MVRAGVVEGQRLASVSEAIPQRRVILTHLEMNRALDDIRDSIAGEYWFRGARLRRS